MNVKKPPGMSRRAINGCAAARGQLGQYPGHPTREGTPRHRSRGSAAKPATTHHTGLSAEGSGGWPMQVTA